MENPVYQEILARVRSIRARVRADVGPIVSPHDLVMYFHGLGWRIGEKARDQVTGEEVTIVGGTTINRNLETSGVVTDQSGAGKAS